jgi:CelD/BcsL family acetyltransferase involved in cellulose biosynthesis
LPGATGDQSHAWIVAWALHIDESYQLRIGVLRRDNHLVAALPMVIRRIQSLRLLEWAAQNISEHCDGLGSPADLMAIWIAIQQAGGYDLVRLKNISRGAKAQFLIDFMENEEIANRMYRFDAEPN